ncbi:MAG: hypothetical protein J1G06_03175 [Oscillospiraceae bacterium]|nr:hypothetical protein [Oscillospiraceae bacterium]
MADTIVYRQSELDTAITEGVRHITLCAGVFNIPKVHGVSFDRIGPVKVIVQCSRREADAAGMSFEGIYPQYKSEYGIDTRVPMTVVAAVSSGSGGSFVSSGSGLGSGTFGSGSFAAYSVYYGSGSGTGSFAVSFRLSGSCGSDTALTAIDSSKKTIRVYGYGIDLI